MKIFLPICAVSFCALMLCSCADSGEEAVTRRPRTSGETYTIPRTDFTTRNVTEAAPLESGTAALPSEASGSGNRTFSCADITADILANVEMSSMAEVGSDRVGMYINCDIPDGTDFSFFICGSGGFADEVCVINLSGLDAGAFSEAVSSRIEARMNDFEDYNPDEYEKLSEMFTKQTGDYFIYAVTGDNGECERIFDEYTGG